MELNGLERDLEGPRIGELDGLADHLCEDIRRGGNGERGQSGELF